MARRAGHALVSSMVSSMALLMVLLPILSTTRCLCFVVWLPGLRIPETIRQAPWQRGKPHRNSSASIRPTGPRSPAFASPARRNSTQSSRAHGMLSGIRAGSHCCRTSARWCCMPSLMAWRQKSRRWPGYAAAQHQPHGGRGPGGQPRRQGLGRTDRRRHPPYGRRPAPGGLHALGLARAVQARLHPAGPGAPGAPVQAPLSAVDAAPAGAVHWQRALRQGPGVSGAARVLTCIAAGRDVQFLEICTSNGVSIMQTKLTLRLEERLITQAKARAQRHGKSLSQLVADYFVQLDEPVAAQRQALEAPLPPVVASLRGALKGVADLDEGAWREHLRTKHQ